MGVGEVHEVSQVHTKFTLRAESRGVLPFIVDLQNRDPYDIPEETDAIVKVTDIGLAHGINVLQSGANITAVREHFDWAQPMTVREYLQLTGAKLAPSPRRRRRCWRRRFRRWRHCTWDSRAKRRRPRNSRPRNRSRRNRSRSILPPLKSRRA